MKNLRLLLVPLLVVVLLTACDSRLESPALRATAQALETAIPLTATQRAASLPNPYSQLQTAEAQATQVAQRAQATLAAQQTLQAAQGNATAQAFAPIIAELPYFGIDPATEGRPGWIHPPLTLTAQGYRSTTYGNAYPQTVMRDGVLSAKIRWNTRYGTGGCGFVLRANGDDQKPSQYVVLMTRAGWLLFVVMKDGEIANLRPMAIRDHDAQFDWHNDATNQLTVVLRDDRIAIYTNHALHKVIDPNEMPSLYIPRPVPPSQGETGGEAVPPLALPAPPAPPSEGGEMAYLQAVQQYSATVQAALRDYIASLDEIINRTRDENARAALENYRASVQQQSAWFQQSSAALQFYLGHRSDLNFGAGFLSFVAAAESASATCTFDEAWLWILSP